MRKVLGIAMLIAILIFIFCGCAKLGLKQSLVVIGMAVISAVIVNLTFWLIIGG